MSTSFNFPANPTLNQIVVLPDGNSAQWNGIAWVSVANNVTYPLAISNGGTGATNPSTARINLGLNTATGEFIADKDGTVALPGIAFKSEPGLGWYRQSANLFATAALGLKTSELGAAVAANTYMSLYPRVVGGSSLYLAGYPAGAADGRTLAFATDSSGHHIFESLAGAATAKGMDFAFNSVLVSRGQLTVGSGNTVASLILDAAAANGKDILARSAGVNRWYMRLGEGPSNDDFVLWSYDNDGTTLRERMRIARADGTLAVKSAGYFDMNFFIGIDGVIGRSLGVGPLAGPWWRVTKDTATVIRMYWNNDASHAWYYDISTGIYGFGTNGGSYVLNNDGDTAQKKTAGGWAAFSDARIKQDIEDYTPGLEAVLKFRPRVFSFRAETGYDTSERHVGVVTQEAIQAMPDTVSIAPGKIGDIELDDMGTFNPSNIQYALINAVKTLNQRLAAIGA